MYALIPFNGNGTAEENTTIWPLKQFFAERLKKLMFDNGVRAVVFVMPVYAKPWRKADEGGER